MTRWSWKKVNMLQNSKGQWVESKDNLFQMIISFFRLLCNQKDVLRTTIITKMKFSLANEWHNGKLIPQITNEEVYNVVFLIRSNISPSKDGYPTLFY